MSRKTYGDYSGQNSENLERAPRAHVYPLMLMFYAIGIIIFKIRIIPTIVQQIIGGLVVLLSLVIYLPYLVKENKYSKSTGRDFLSALACILVLFVVSWFMKPVGFMDIINDCSAVEVKDLGIHIYLAAASGVILLLSLFGFLGKGGSN